jgi:hypothetical protein
MGWAIDVTVFCFTFMLKVLTIEKRGGLKVISIYGSRSNLFTPKVFIKICSGLIL